MFKKLRGMINTKYSTISAYVIITTVIIFLLAFVTMNMKDIFTNILDFMKYLLDILFPVIIGVIIAYVLDPLVGLFERNFKKIKFLKFKKTKKYRTIAVFTSIILVVVVVSGLITMFIFSITRQIASISLDEGIAVIADYINSFALTLAGLGDKLATLNIESSSISNMFVGLTTSITKSMQQFTTNFLAVTSGFSRTVASVFIAIIISIYLLLDKDTFISYGNKLVSALWKEKTVTKYKDLWHEFDKIFAGYVRGQLLDALFMCIVISVALSIIGIKFSVLIGVIAGLANLIPYFGPIVAYAGTLLFGLLNGQVNQVIIAIIVLVIIQQVDGSIIGPKFIGNSVDLKPVLILIAVIIGASVAGVLGMVLAVPVTGFLKVILVRFVDRRLEKKKLEELQGERNE
ncbi:MAG: AI-2E family transporter [Vallitaleaceae bacterium]|nr:AI-2E family transporter [Vallitaleaceae bacterium]